MGRTTEIKTLSAASKTDAGNYVYSNTAKPNQLTKITDNPLTITAIHDINYYINGKTKSVIQGQDKIEFTYGPDMMRVKTKLYSNSTLLQTKYFALGNYEEEVDETRGYTAQKHLDVFGLIKLNGKMYEPLTARFLSPDNYVQSPEFSQSFNRYGYYFNNPLIYTDSDGNWAGWDDLIVGGVGFAFGYVGGFSSDCLFGKGNSLMGGDKFSTALGSGFNEGIKQILIGGSIGGVIGGISSYSNERNFWTGKSIEQTQFYVDKQGNIIKTEQIEKYRQWQAEGRELSAGQKHALQRVNISSVEGQYADGDIVNESFSINLPKGVNSATLTAKGHPAFDLTTTANGFQYT